MKCAFFCVSILSWLLTKCLVQKNYFNDFELSVIKEPYLGTLSLFENSSSGILKDQCEIFSILEKKAPFVNAASFRNQVHFQNAYQTSVQRWFPYREGYSTCLVNAFIKELKIKGNIFDPFSGSGTTLLAARHNNLDSFGVDVNPISVLVSKVENQKYSNLDIVNFKDELREIQSLVESVN